MLKKWTTFEYRVEFWSPDVPNWKEMLVSQWLITFFKGLWSIWKDSKHYFEIRLQIIWSSKEPRQGKATTLWLELAGWLLSSPAKWRAAFLPTLHVWMNPNQDKCSNQCDPVEVKPDLHWWSLEQKCLQFCVLSSLALAPSGGPTKNRKNPICVMLPKVAKASTEVTVVHRHLKIIDCLRPALFVY